MLESTLIAGITETPRFQVATISDPARRASSRTIYIPNAPMQMVQSRSVKFLRTLINVSGLQMPFATGGLPGFSAVQNALRHIPNRYLETLDLSRAYESVNGERLISILSGLISGRLFDHEISRAAWRYWLTERGGLITGAAASPDLFNIYTTTTIDEPLTQVIGKYGLTYSRYLDDLTISSETKIGTRKIKQIKSVIRAAGFKVNPSKSRSYDLRTSPRVVINGVGIRPDGSLYCPQHYVRRLIGLLERYLSYGEGDPSLIYGLWGVWWQIEVHRFSGIDDDTRNQSEKKLVRLFNRFRLEEWANRPSVPSSTQLLSF